MVKVNIVSDIRRRFAAAPTHRDLIGTQRQSGIHRVQKVGVVCGGRLDEDNLGAWSDRMRPFDVERDFIGPVRVVGRCSRARNDLGEIGLRQVELLIKYGQVAFDLGVVEGVDDGDGLPGAVERELVESVSVANHRRGHRLCGNRGRGRAAKSRASPGRRASTTTTTPNGSASSMRSMTVAPREVVAVGSHRPYARRFDVG